MITPLDIVIVTIVGLIVILLIIYIIISSKRGGSCANCQTKRRYDKRFGRRAKFVTAYHKIHRK